MFKEKGPVSLVIGEVKFTECRFAQGKSATDFDICFEVTNAADEAQHDYVYLEWSDSYGMGVMQTMKQRDISMRTLRGLGFAGDDLLELQVQLGGKTVPGVVRESKPNKDGKTFMNVFFGGSGNAPKAEDVLTNDEIVKRLTAKSAGGSAAAPVKPAAFPKANSAQRQTTSEQDLSPALDNPF